MEKAHTTAHFVTGDICVGGYLRAADADFVRANGFKRIVKMFADDGTYPGGFHRHQGVKYYVAAADDVATYDIRADIVGAIKFIIEGVNAQEKILIHCHAGISRSVTIVVAYLMICRGQTLQTALGAVRKVRPIANPNPGFMRTLTEIDQSLTRLRAAARG